MFHINMTSSCFKDIDDTRLALAKSMGADVAIKVTTDDPSTLAANISNIIEGFPDLTIECSGTNFGFSTGIYVRFSLHSVKQRSVGLYSLKRGHILISSRK